MVLLRGLPLFLVLLPYSYNLHIGIMVVYGFATAHMVLTPEILIQLYGSDNLNKLVSIFNFTSKGPGILIGTTSGGFILQHFNYKIVLITSGVVFVVSCVTCFFSKLWWENHENKGKDPRTSTSVSSQDSQGYDSAGSDFVDIEGFSEITPIPDSSLPEISLQSGVYDDLGNDRLNLSTPKGVNDMIVTAASAPNEAVSMVTSESFYPASATIQGQYSIAPTTTIINRHPKTYHTIVNVSHQPKNH